MQLVNTILAMLANAGMRRQLPSLGESLRELLGELLTISVSEKFCCLSLGESLRKNLLRPLVTSCDVTVKWLTIQTVN